MHNYPNRLPVFILTVAMCFWTREQIQKKLIKIFPEGQIVTVVDDKIVGCALSIIVDYDKVKNDHTYAQVTGKETFNTHALKEISCMALKYSSTGLSWFASRSSYV